jgi:hypothetical protein
MRLYEDEIRSVEGGADTCGLGRPFRPQSCLVGSTFGLKESAFSLVQRGRFHPPSDPTASLQKTRYKALS